MSVSRINRSWNHPETPPEAWYPGGNRDFTLCMQHDDLGPLGCCLSGFLMNL
jgi:hypothetical protein